MSNERRAPTEATTKVDPSIEIHKTLYPYLNYKEGGFGAYSGKKQIKSRLIQKSCCIFQSIRRSTSPHQRQNRRRCQTRRKMVFPWCTLIIIFRPTPTLSTSINTGHLITIHSLIPEENSITELSMPLMLEKNSDYLLSNYQDSVKESSPLTRDVSLLTMIVKLNANNNKTIFSVFVQIGLLIHSRENNLTS